MDDDGFRGWELLFFEGVPLIGCPCPDGSTHTYLHKGSINVDSLVLKLSHQIKFLKRHEIERALLCQGPEGQWGWILSRYIAYM